MKTQFLVISLALASFTAVGQKAETTSLKGKFGIGGSLGYYESSGNGSFNPDLTNATKSFRVAPSFTYFTAKNMVTGLAIGYQSSEYESSQSTKMFSISPMVQYLIPLGNEKFGLYTQAYLSFGSGKIKYSTYGYGSTDIAITNFTGGISPGIYFFPSRKFMLNASFGSIFRYSKTKNKNESIMNYDSSTSGNSIEILNFSTTGQNILGLQIGGSFLF